MLIRGCIIKVKQLETSNYRYLERTRYRTRFAQTFIRMHNDKNSATIVGAVIYIAVSVKHTNFCIYGLLNQFLDISEEMFRKYIA